MKLIGLSGGPGCGKSAAAHFFEKAGLAVADADKVCHSIYEEKTNSVLEALRSRWGESVFSAGGTVNKAAIAEIVFNNEEERVWLNGIMHPEIFRRIREQFAHADGEFAVVEAALLFEAGWHEIFYRTVCVWTDPAIRMERLLKRGWTRDHAQKRIDSQMPDNKKLELADFAVINNSTIENLERQCMLILEQLKQLDK